MNQIDNSEQWKLDGDCRQCRRKKYCSKPCTINKRQLESLFRNMIADAMYMSVSKRIK